MAKTFEEILNGRKLHELTDDDIEEVVSKMNPEQLEKFDKELKKVNKTKTKTPSKNQQKKQDEFNKALFS